MKFYREQSQAQLTRGPGRIYAENMEIGDDVYLGSDIGSSTNPLKFVRIGDHTSIGPRCNVGGMPELRIGDYTKIHRNCLLFGRNALFIGHNCWFGEGTIIDAEGTTRIGNNVGAGAHSQLWSHIRHGDLMMGCRYFGFGSLTIDNDAWMVGHCVVSPVHVARFSVVLVGSVLTKNTLANHVYGGSPAVDLTDKLGEPYAFPTIDQRMDIMRRYLMPRDTSLLRAVTDWEPDEPFVTQFNVATREYTKKSTKHEIEFMKSILPEVKFVPREV